MSAKWSPEDNSRDMIVLYCPEEENLSKTLISSFFSMPRWESACHCQAFACSIDKRLHALSKPIAAIEEEGALAAKCSAVQCRSDRANRPGSESPGTEARNRY